MQRLLLRFIVIHRGLYLNIVGDSSSHVGVKMPIEKYPWEAFRHSIRCIVMGGDGVKYQYVVFGVSVVGRSPS